MYLKTEKEAETMISILMFKELYTRKDAETLKNLEGIVDYIFVVIK